MATGSTSHSFIHFGIDFLSSEELCCHNCLNISRVRPFLKIPTLLDVCGVCVWRGWGNLSLGLVKPHSDVQRTDIPKMILSILLLVLVFWFYLVLPQIDKMKPSRTLFEKFWGFRRKFEKSRGVKFFSTSSQNKKWRKLFSMMLSYPVLFSINSRLQTCYLFACIPRMNNSTLSKRSI